jgi:amino acid transporter
VIDCRTGPRSTCSIPNLALPFKVPRYELTPKDHEFCLLLKTEEELVANAMQESGKKSVKTPLLPEANECLSETNFMSPSSPWVMSKTESGSIVKKRTLGVCAVAMITYFNVCGGPWGSENFVSEAGPLPGLVGLLLIPLLWGLPLSLVTAELSSAFPDDGGYSIWVGEAFGEFWAFQEGFWSWGSGVIDNALYPTLVFQIGATFFADGESELITNEWYKYLVKVALATLFTLPNFFAVLYMGKYMKWMAMFVMAPFLVFAAMCIPHAVPSRLLEPPSGGYPAVSRDSWLQLVNVLYWNFSGFDCASTFAGEVQQPWRTYPLGLLLALLLTVSSYLLPLSLGVMAYTPETITTWGSDPGECSFSCIVQGIGGEWLSLWILIAGIAGNGCMFMAEMFEDSWQIFGLAETGMLPRCLAYRHPRYKTPINAVLFNFMCVVGLVYLDFSDNLAINNFFSCGAAMLEIIAFLYLRVSRPSLKRPYRLPLGTFGSAVFMAVPLLLGFFVLFSGCMNSWLSFYTNMAGIAVGAVGYKILRYCGMRYHYDPRRARALSGEVVARNVSSIGSDYNSTT